VGQGRSQGDTQARREALVFRGEANQSGKGDFTISGSIPGETLALGCWFYLPKDANVREVGLLIVDNEGESLQFLTPADWTGWKWVETPVTPAALKQAYPRRTRTANRTCPSRVCASSGGPGAWPQRGDRRCRPGKDPLPQENRSEAIMVDLLSSTDVPRGGTCGGSLLVTNPGSKKAKVQIDLALQHDGNSMTSRCPIPSAVSIWPARPVAGAWQAVKKLPRTLSRMAWTTRRRDSLPQQFLGSRG